MKTYVYTVNEILTKDIQTELTWNPLEIRPGRWTKLSKIDGKYKYVELEEYAVWYDRMIPLYRKLITNTLATEQVDEADIIILISPVCPCCDHSESRGDNMLRSIRKIREQGPGSPILAVYVGGTNREISNEVKEEANGFIISTDVEKIIGQAAEILKKEE